LKIYSRSGRIAETRIATINPLRKAKLNARVVSTDNTGPWINIIIKQVHTLTSPTKNPALHMADLFLHLITPKAAVRLAAK
jgi:hypothetical protein